MAPDALAAGLRELRDRGTILSRSSVDLLAIEDPEALDVASQAWSHRPLAEQSCVTCLTTMQYFGASSNRPDSILILGRSWC